MLQFRISRRCSVHQCLEIVHENILSCCSILGHSRKNLYASPGLKITLTYHRIRVHGFLKVMFVA